MVGREAYHHPWLLTIWDEAFFGAPSRALSRDVIEEDMVRYMERQAVQGVAWSHVARHMLGLWNGTPGARRWRQVWSDHRLKALPVAEVARRARAARLAGQHSNPQLESA